MLVPVHGSEALPNSSVISVSDDLGGGGQKVTSIMSQLPSL